MIRRTFARPAARRLAALALAAPLLATACSTVEPGDAGGDGSPADPAASSSAPALPPYDASALRKPSGRMLGVASEGGPADLAPVNSFAAKSGHHPDVREYYQEWGEDFDTAGNTALWKAGVLPLLSLVPDQTPLARIASGAEDAYLTRFAQQVRGFQGPVVIAFAPEMNGAWTPWGPGKATADDYVKAWRHIHDAFRDQQATNVLWMWTPHVADSGTGAPLKPYYPGDDYVDWLGLIGYYGPQDGTAYKSLFTPTLKTVRGFSGKPVLIAETGVAEGPQKVAQINDLFSGAAGTDGLIGLVWYDLRKKWPGATQLTDWRVDSSAAAAAAVVKAVGAKGFGHPVTPAG
ncbi:glycoside hydrolase family 26 protein [Kitasatospora sp. NPDC059571]|uniref:glycoside hydrolase family 26 protein n=1 Tax=Kitasatospora sp. NPDC059571 TaxID=3346871 RepID=UPI003688CA17